MRVEKREIRDVVAGRLGGESEEGERRRVRRWEGCVLEVEGRGRARSWVFRVVSDRGFSDVETCCGMGSCAHL